MKKILIVIVFCLIYTGASAQTTGKKPEGSSARQTSFVQDMPTSTDLLSDFKVQQERLSFFKEMIEAQDKRIGDLAFILSTSLACFGALMTVIVVFFSFRATKEAGPPHSGSIFPNGMTH